MVKANYRYIKDLVFDLIHQTDGKVGYDAVTKRVLKQFPHSKWKPSHWAYYRSQINCGKFKDEFSAEEKKNLALKKEGKAFRRTRSSENQYEADPVKRIGDELLAHVRAMIREIAGDDEDCAFKLNRWVYARLQQDEIRKKRPVKQQLWDMGMRSCRSCQKRFETLKGVEIHRIEESLAYSVENCELLCRSCHQSRR